MSNVQLDPSQNSTLGKMLAESATVLIWIANEQKECVYFNKAWLAFTGRTLEEEYGFGWAEGVHPEDFDRCLDIFVTAFDARKPFDMDYRLKKFDQTYRWIRDEGAPYFNEEGTFVGYIGSCFDITEMLESKEAIAKSEEKFQWLVHAINEVFWLSDLALTEIIYVSPALEKLWGIKVTELYESPRLFIDAIHHEDRDNYLKIVDAFHSKGLPYECEYRIYDKNNRMLWIRESGYPVKDERRKANVMAGICTDITEQKEKDKKLEEKKAHLEFLAFHDPLTSLPNRLSFYSLLEVRIARAQRERTKIAVLLIDLDRFKIINDSLGHSVGDHFLQIISKRLTSSLRPSDVATRIGGDEFALIIEEFQIVEDIKCLTRNILKILGVPIHIQGKNLFSTASIGISFYPDDGESADVLLKAADIAMYIAKDMGKNTFQIYSHSISKPEYSLFSIESDMIRAIEEEQFFIEYQPQFNLKSGYITGVEALIRWNHPNKGFLYPDLFIPIAEENGLILKIGRWVLEESVKQLKSWRDQGIQLDKVAVNLSARQFHQPQLGAIVLDILNRYQLNASDLELEITESIAMNDIVNANKNLRELKSLGLQLSIDDFGTGYSSLSYLKSFPIDKLKIDRSFIKDLEYDVNDAAISASIIALSHTMNLTVIAEGVENEHHVDFLKQQNCDEAQGIYFGAPMRGQKIQDLLKKKCQNRSVVCL